MPRRVQVPIRFGLSDNVDPRHAPHGVFKSSKNFRVREDGRLGCRHGYQPLTMTSRNGTLVAYDLHTYRGRLLALGSDDGDGYPTDLFEYLGLSSEFWRGTDPTDQRVTVGPFTNLRSIAQVPHQDEGIDVIDAAAGGGYVFSVYRSDGRTYSMCVRQSDDQVIFLGLSGITTGLAKVVWAVDRFFIAQESTSSNTVLLLRFQPGAQTALFSTTAFAASGSAITALDICSVTNPTTASVMVVMDRGSSSDLTVRAFDSDGAQVGSDIDVSGTNTIFAMVEADQTHDTINLYTVEGTDTGQLRTWAFDGTGAVGPTATTAGASGGICRLTAQGSVEECVAVAVNESASGRGVTVQGFDVDDHASAFTTFTLDAMTCQSRLVSGQSANQDVAVVFSAFQTNSSLNLLVFATSNSVHMATANYTKARAVPANGVNLSLDSGKLCWVAVRDDDSDGKTEPSVTLVDFKSTDRRQSAEFGSFLYLSGAGPLVYDGRTVGELGFPELPAITGTSTSNGAGSLANSATYTWVVHFEVYHPDGSVDVSAPSLPVTDTTDATHDTADVTVTVPHLAQVVSGQSLYGSDIVAVLSRTEWESTTSTQGSVLRESARVSVPNGLASYGDPLTITDVKSDADLSTSTALYTQSQRGPLSGVLENNAPRACSFITATESRLLTGGIDRDSDVQISKEAFPGEVFSFSEFSTFFATVRGRVLAVRAVDNAKLIFTADEIFAVGGNGPDDQGGNALEPPVLVHSSTGIKSWTSLLDAPPGLFFQGNGDKLFLAPRGSGSPIWAGAPIQRTLADYPDISGTARHVGDNAALFACQTAASDDARIAVLDFRTNLWLTDTPPLQSSQGIEAIVAWDGRVAYVSGGVVYAQSPSSFADTASTFIEHQVVTQPIYSFGLGSYALHYELMVVGEYRGDFNLRVRVSLDDGKTFGVDLNWDILASNGYAAGDTVKRRVALPQTVCPSVVVEVTARDAGGGASEGFVLNQITILAEEAPGLEELDPAEMG